MANILGIDPGVNGGLVLLNTDTNEIIKKMIMPTYTEMTSTKKRRYKVDAEALTVFLMDNEHLIDYVVIEKVNPSLTFGAIPSFSLGEQFGRVVGAVTALDFVIRFVGARKWQNSMLIPGTEGTTKERAAQTAKVLFPNIDLTPTPRAKKPHDGLVDALLIARYGSIFEETISAIN